MSKKHGTSDEPEPATLADYNRALEALDEIARYIIPAVPIDGRGLMVPAENVRYLRDVARKAIGLKATKA